MTKTQIKAIQAELAKLLMYGGKIDGIIGPKTTAGIKAYQHVNGMAETGVINSAFTRMMFKTVIPSRVQPTTRPRYDFPHDDTASLMHFYGEPGTNHILLPLPYKMKLAWDTDVVVEEITINKFCKLAFLGFFEDVLAHYGQEQIEELGIDLYGGSYMNRNIRGGDRPSTHAFAAAIDLHPAANQLRWGRNKALFATPPYKPMLDIAEANSLVSLGRRANFDYMHIMATR